MSQPTLREIRVKPLTLTPALARLLESRGLVSFVRHPGLLRPAGRSRLQRFGSILQRRRLESVDREPPCDGVDPASELGERHRGEIQQRRICRALFGETVVVDLLAGPGSGGELAQPDHSRAALERVESAPQRGDPLVIGRTDFWTRIDERDAAQAIEKGLTADFEGHHAVFVNDSHNLAGVPSITLAELFFPEARLRREQLEGTRTLVSIDAARKLIGFEPEHSVARWF